MRKFVTGAAVAALMAVSGAAHAETVRVGFISPFSGPFAVWGAQFRMGVEAFQKVHGDTVNGHKIEVIYRDTGGVNPARARQHAEELILRERVRFLAGFTMTPNALAVAEIADETKIPVVIMNAATGMITRQSPYFVRVSMTIPQYVRPIGTWAAKEGGIKTAYTIVTDYAPGHDAEIYFSRGFEEHGGKVLGKDRVPLATTDFAPFLERAARSGAQAVYIFVPSGAPSVAAIREFDNRGLRKKGVTLLAAAEVAELFLPSIGDAVIGTVSGLHYTASNKSELNQKLRETMRELHGPDAVPDIATVGAWDGMKLIYEAVAKHGPKVTGDQAMAMWKGMEWESPRGPVKIDPEERDIIQNVYLRRVEKRDGRLINVDFYTEPMVKDPWKIDNPAKK